MPGLQSLFNFIRSYNIKANNSAFSDSKIAHFFSIPENKDINESIGLTLNLPYSLFIEENSYENSEKLLKTLVASDPPDLLLSISTYSTYTSNLSHLLTESINKRFKLNGNKYNEIKTCLHEAIINAVLHGNLCIESNFQTIKGLYSYQTEISKRLNMDIYKSRRVNIMAWNKNDHLQISVSDEGNGFSISNFKEDFTSPNGRGLMLIIKLSDSMWMGSDKRTLYMAFSHSA
jgi:anti-sigma regulatory factor (Ser/Thr protein kinase)